MTIQRVCDCHGLERRDFERACAAGAHNVKTCFQHIGRLPQCGDCAPVVRKMLGDHRARQTDEAAAGGLIPPPSS